jgi:hypothetical protein
MTFGIDSMDIISRPETLLIFATDIAAVERVDDHAKSW